MISTLMATMIFSPFVAAILVAVFQGRNLGISRALQGIAAGGSFVSSLAAIGVLTRMTPESASIGLEQRLSWVGTFSINYHLGMDGFAVPTILLAAILLPILVVMEVRRDQPKLGLIALILLAQASLFGLILSRDIFLITFFGLMTPFPFFFITSLWGDGEREQASFRFLIVSALSGILLFLSMIFVFYGSGGEGFALQELLEKSRHTTTGVFLGFEVPLRTIAFVFFVCSFALRIPCWPLQGWYSGFNRVSPTTSLVGLTGIYLPIWMFTFLRLGYSLFPSEFFQHGSWFMTIGIFNLVIGAAGLLSIKELRGFLSSLGLASMGILLVGVGAVESFSLVGVSLHLLSVGLGLGCFGLFVGFIKDRTGSTVVLDEEGRSVFGGISLKAPALSFFVMLFILTTIGFPGSIGFIGQFLIVTGSVFEHPFAIGFFVFGLMFLILGLIYLFRVIFLGKEQRPKGEELELSWVDRACMFPMVFLIIFLGIYPKPVMELIRPAAQQVLSQMR